MIMPAKPSISDDIFNLSFYCSVYTGINRHEGEKVIGLYDTVLKRDDYEQTFINEPAEGFKTGS